MEDQRRLHNELRIVIIGKTGTGKSATANTLIGKDKFESKIGADSVSRYSEKVEGRWRERNIVIVDTPGLFDTHKSQDEVKKEISKCIGISAPGPHAVALVVRSGRITQEDYETVEQFIEYFGPEVYRYMIIVFTRIGDLEDDNTTLTDYVAGLPEDMKKILDLCDDRYVGIDNKADVEKKTETVDKFFLLVEKLKSGNNFACYTNKLYVAAEAILKKRIRDKQIELEARKMKIKQKEEASLKKEGAKLKEQIRQEFASEVLKLEKQFHGDMDDVTLKNQEQKQIEQEILNILSGLKTQVKEETPNIYGNQCYDFSV